MKRIIVSVFVCVIVCSLSSAQNTYPGNGKVGIGVLNPWSTLDVRTAGDQSALNIQNPSHNSYATVDLQLSSGDNYSFSIISAQRNSSGKGSSLFFQTTDDNGSVNPRLWITPNGFVGVGTLSPTEKLAVNGNVRAKKVIVTQSNWPDYVFETSYKLPSLDSISSFIKVNKHLPEIPAAGAIEKDGQDVGEIQKLLLKKVEELTLYVIAQEESTKEIKLQNKDLRLKNTELEKRIQVLEKAF